MSRFVEGLGALKCVSPWTKVGECGALIGAKLLVIVGGAFSLVTGNEPKAGYLRFTSRILVLSNRL